MHLPVSMRLYDVWGGDDLVEHSLYVNQAQRGRGVGRALLPGLIDSTEAAGIWTIQAGILPENLASIRLHPVAGFRIVGTRERVGKMATGNSPASGGTWS